MPVRHTTRGRPRRGFRSATIALLCAVSTAAACTGGDSAGSDIDSATAPTTTSTPAPTIAVASIPDGRPYAVLERTETLVDTSRPTDDPLDVLDAPDRTIATDLYVPRERGPFPLVVLAHGKDGSPERLTMLASGWASAGYVVAVPYFPLTNDGIDGGARIPDYVNQPEDVSFVIDEMLRLSALDHGALSQRIDPDRIGVAGHSLGAATAYAVAFNSCCLDRRIDATILMAGRRFPFRGEYTLDGVAAMWVHGDADLSLPHADSAEAYAQAASPKALVTLLGGSHSPPFEDTPDPHDRVVTLVTLDFWDAYLLGDSRANERIRADGEEPGLATVDYVP